MVNSEETSPQECCILCDITEQKISFVFLKVGPPYKLISLSLLNIIKLIIHSKNKCVWQDTTQRGGSGWERLHTNPWNTLNNTCLRQIFISLDNGLLPSTMTNYDPYKLLE